MLAAWIEDAGFQNTIALATLPSFVRTDAHLSHPQEMRAVQSQASKRTEFLGKYQIARPLEAALQTDHAVWRKRSSTVLLHDEAERRGMEYVTLIRFCEEGNNFPEGVAMAKDLVRSGLCGSGPEIAWKQPDCWALAEGSSSDASLWN